MQGLIVFVGVNICRGLDVSVAHEFLRHVDGDPGLLKIRAEGVAEAVRYQIGCNSVLDDFVPLQFCAHVNIQIPLEASPQAAKAVLILKIPGPGRKYG